MICLNKQRNVGQNVLWKGLRGWKCCQIIEKLGKNDSSLRAEKMGHPIILGCYCVLLYNMKIVQYNK